jgi:hypothetical protein
MHTPLFIEERTNNSKRNSAKQKYGFNRTKKLLMTISQDPLPFFIEGIKGVTREVIDLVCQVAGHRWRYKDYTNWMKEDGNSYDFKASRQCVTCKKHGYYFHNRWIETNSKNMKYDIINDECYSKHPPRLKKSKFPVKLPNSKNLQQQLRN